MSQEIFVWRLEDERGIGVYQSSDKKDSIWNISTNSFRCSKRNPTFCEDIAFDDIIVNDIKHCSFGFKNLDQYYAWVFKKEWRDALAKNKALLRKYFVEDGIYLESKYQVLFRKDLSTLIEELAPNFENK